MRQRRQVGFIKTYSNKALEPFKDQPSEFSYFRLKNRREDEEFSPYKIEAEEHATLKRTVPAPRPPLPIPNKRPEDHFKKTESVLDKLEAIQRKSAGHSDKPNDKMKADQLYDRIKQNIANYEERKNSSKGKLQENIGSIRNKIEELDSALKELKIKKESQEKERETRVASKKKISYKFEEDSDSSSSEESEEVVIKSIPSPKVSQAKAQELRRKEDVPHPSQHSQKSKEKQIPRAIESSESEEEDDSDIYQQAHSASQPSISQHTRKQNVVTFNSRSRNAPLQIEEYTSSSEQQEDPAIKPSYTIPNRRTAQEEAPRSEVAAKDFYKNKGGVCFDIDVKEFANNGPPPKDDRAQRPKKPQKVDKRSELLKRRQAAKVYDKMARRALFSYN